MDYFLTPTALARAAHPAYRWGRMHHLIQKHLLLLATHRLTKPDGTPCKRLMVLTPPQHAKSTIVSRLAPPVLLGQNPAAKLILLSYSAELAAAHGSAARDHVRDRAARLNPRLALHPDRQRAGQWETTAGGYMRSASIQGTVTGMAADGIVIDDPFKGSEDSGSVTVRDKVWATYSAAAETRLAPDGWVVVVNTPWHPDDLCGRLLATEPEKWLVLRFPALSEGDGDPLGRPEGAPLWPERYPPDWYADKRRTLELRGQGHVWDALYQCRPTGDASLSAFNDPAYFGPHLWVDEPPVNANNPVTFRVLALDPSKSKTGRSGDYAAFCDATLLADRHVYCRTHLNREPLPDTYARAVALVGAAAAEGRPYARLLVESNQFQEAVGLAIADRLTAAGLHVPVDLHHTPSDQSKTARIQVDLGPLLEAKRLHFVGQTVSNRLTVQQTRELPNGAHDDGPDAVSMATQALNLLLTGSKRPAHPGPTVLRAYGGGRH